MKNIKNGVRKAGILPYNPRIILDTLKLETPGLPDRESVKPTALIKQKIYQQVLDPPDRPTSP
jgi:hypothetical protein